MAWSNAARQKASAAAKLRWEDKRKMGAPAITVDKYVVDTITGKVPEAAEYEQFYANNRSEIEDRLQQIREADPRRRINPGQEAFDASLEEMHAMGRKDDIERYGMPAPVADYQGVAAGLPFDPATIGQYFGSSWDKSVVSPQMMRDYGINPETEVPKWCLMDNYGAKGVDYELEYLNDNPHDRICTYVGPDKSKTGRKFHRAGMTLCARPREVADWIEQRHRGVSVNLKENEPKGNPNLPHDDSPEMQKLRAATQETIAKYMRDSPSAYLGRDNLEAASNKFSLEETAKFEDDALRGANPLGYERLQSLLAENARDKTAEQLKAIAAGRGKTVSVSIAFDQQGRIIR